MKNWLTKVKRDPDGYLLALLVFLLPFERIPSYKFAGITLRLSLLAAALVIVRATWIYLQNRGLKLSFTVKSLLAFLLWLVIITPVSINLTRGAEVTVFTFFTAFTALGITVLLRREHLNLLLRSLLLSATMVGVFGLYQYFGNVLGLGAKFTGIQDRYSYQLFGFPRIQATSLEPLYFAAYLLLPLSIIISAYSLGQLSRRWLWLLWLLGTDLFLTVSRGGNLAFVIMLSAFLTVSLFSKWSFRRLATIVLIVIISYGCALLLISKLNHPPQGVGKGKGGLASYSQQIQTTGLEGGGDERAQARKSALVIFKQHPLIGIGPGNYGPYIQHNVKPVSGWVIVNNETLELLAETGIIGFFLFMVFAASLFVMGARAVVIEKDPLSRAWLLGLLGFLLAMAIQYQTFSTLFIVQFWVAIGLLLATSGLNKSKT